MRTAAVSGATLIIVIFIMLLFGVLGWSLAVMQAGMSESSLRAIAPDQALNLAEAGARWGINEFIMNATLSSSDDTCDSAGEWVTHALYPGQYQVCTRGPQEAESGSVVVESIGYVPNVTAYQAKRKVKIMASVGSFDKSMIVRNLFNWTGADKSDSFINGSMLCLSYEANGNGVFNEEGIDYANSNNTAYVLPRSQRSRRGSVAPRRDVGECIFPEIDMAYYQTDPQATVLAPHMTGTIENVTLAGGDSRVEISQANFFGSSPGQWTGMALRNISRGPWKNGSWKDIKQIAGNAAVLNGTVDWIEGEHVTVSPRIGTDPVFSEIGHTRVYQYSFNFNCNLTWPVGQAIRNFSKGTWEYPSWGVITAVSHPTATSTRVTVEMDASVTTKTWQLNEWIGLVRRFTEDDCEWWSNGLLFNHNVLYVESDALFDTRDGSINTKRTGVVCEGDAVIRGVNGLTLEKKPLLYPNLATKYGNIYSPDRPSGNNNNQRLSKRNFDDIVFTQFGDIYFNYVDCMAMYGGNVTLAGVFQMRYDPDLTRLGGYAFGVSGMNWQEE